MTTHRPVAARAAGLAVALGLVLTLGLSGCSVISDLIGGNSVDRDESGVATEDNDNADAFTIAVGDCLNDSSIINQEVTTIPLVTCDKPHDTEVVASILVEDGEFPGDDAIGDPRRRGMPRGVRGLCRPLLRRLGVRLRLLPPDRRVLGRRRPGDPLHGL